jgi:hypothetical protein
VDVAFVVDGAARALAPSDFPGTSAEASPASPAVSAAAPTSNHLRVRPSRPSAASRASAAVILFDRFP